MAMTHAPGVEEQGIHSREFMFGPVSHANYQQQVTLEVREEKPPMAWHVQWMGLNLSSTSKRRTHYGRGHHVGGEVKATVLSQEHL